MGSPIIAETGEVITMDQYTNMVHCGCLYGFYLEDTDIDTAESKDMLIVVGKQPLHIILNLEAFGGQLTAGIYEGCEFSEIGTPVLLSCFNRIRQVPIESKVYVDPTITTTGVQFVSRRVLAHAQGAAGVTSSVTAGAERILKPNTNYLLRLTGVSDNISATLVGQMHE